MVPVNIFRNININNNQMVNIEMLLNKAAFSFSDQIIINPKKNLLRRVTSSTRKMVNK